MFLTISFAIIGRGTLGTLTPQELVVQGTFKDGDFVAVGEAIGIKHLLD